jgi:hypothetical protein
MQAALRRRRVGAGIAAFGIGVAVMSAQFEMGTTRNFGPGAFPVVVAAMVTLLGLAIAIFKTASGRTVVADEASTPALRHALQVFGAVLVFAVSVERAGLLIASALLIVLASFDEARRRPFDVVSLALVLAIGATALFVWMLGLPLPVVPPGFGPE